MIGSEIRRGGRRSRWKKREKKRSKCKEGLIEDEKEWKVKGYREGDEEKNGITDVTWERERKGDRKKGGGGRREK